MKIIYPIAFICLVANLSGCKLLQNQHIDDVNLTVRIPNLPQGNTVKLYNGNNEIASGSSIPKNVPCTLRITIDSIPKYEMVINTGINFIDTLDIWLYNSAALINCSSGYQQLSGKIINNDGSTNSYMLVKSLSNHTKFIRTSDQGAFKLCFPGNSYSYRYVVSYWDREDNIDVLITNQSDPDLRIDVYLSDNDKDTDRERSKAK